MPRVGITAYDLLISCPGDVNKYICVVKECIDEFNRLLGRVNNSEIVGRHWSTDSYSQSGNKPQELLNKQFVRDCDAAVAIFWTRFGTPTDKYGSGTEEEIEEMLSADKQIFMYFIDEPVNPSELNSEQYKKIQDFREKYKNRGIYFIVKNEDEFRRQFTNDLALHFLTLMAGVKDNSQVEVKKPNLSVLGYDSKTFHVTTSSSAFAESKFIKDQENKILSIIDELSHNILPERKEEEKEEKIEVKTDLQKVAISNFLKSKTINAEISDEHKTTILEFTSRTGVTLPEGFWNVGNLTKTQALLNPMFGGGGPSYNGDDSEKDRYDKLDDLYWKILELNQYLDYFCEFDKYHIVKLILSNSGTDVDEDIDIKLKLKKGILVKKKQFPVPDFMIIDTILDMKFVEMVLKAKETDSVSSYSDYPILPPRFTYPVTNPFNQPSAQQEYEESQEKYNDKLKELCCYELFDNQDEDVILIHVSYLKHHTSVSFPSALVFTEKPEKIEYEITSKHTADVIKGILEMS